jgi:hypothetical protein
LAPNEIRKKSIRGSGRESHRRVKVVSEGKRSSVREGTSSTFDAKTCSQPCRRSKVHEKTSIIAYEYNKNNNALTQRAVEG